MRPVHVLSPAFDDLMNTIDRDIEIVRYFGQGVAAFKTGDDLLIAVGFGDSEV